MLLAAAAIPVNMLLAFVGPTPMPRASIRSKTCDLNLFDSTEQAQVDWCLSITADVFKCLTSMTSLEDLDVRETDFNDNGLRSSVDSLPLLKTLDLVGCRGIPRVLDPPLSNAVVVASVAQCFECLDADDEDEY